jgi:hypothetical protein
MASEDTNATSETNQRDLSELLLFVDHYSQHDVEQCKRRDEVKCMSSDTVI